MPFLRFSRDKRGYEHTYLVQATNRRGKPVRPRVLYWFRTPPGVRLGRQPFDDEVRRLLETQNPGILFDWAALATTPFPPQEAEHWRERRKAERAARQSRRDDEAEEIPEDLPAGTPIEFSIEVPEAEAVADLPASSPVAASVAAAASVEGEAQAVDGAGLRKRRRRGGRRRKAKTDIPTEGSPDLAPPAGEPAESAVSASEDQE